MLLVVVGLRPLISESYDSAGSLLSAGRTELVDPSPLRTLLLDSAIMLAFGGWLLARAIGPRWKYRWSGIEIGAVLVAVAAGVSCFTAGNKRLAINATVDWLALPVVTIALAQLVRSGWQVRLALCVILATAAAQASECVNQVLYSFDESAQDYSARREEFWVRQGVSLDSPQVELFERRLAAREASGYTWHSNVAGAYLVLTGFAALGLAVGKWRGPRSKFRKGFAVCAAAVGAGLLGTTVLTGSRGAMAAGAIGALLVVAFGVLRHRITRNRRRALVFGWGCGLGALAAVIGHGLYHGGLPGSSLDFRWQYWTASAGMVADHPLTGVGMENFGRHYLQYKSIVSPEEVKNPHNLLVSAATDWGLVGLLGVGAMLVGGSIVLTRGPQDPAGTGPPGAAASSERSGRPLTWIVALAGSIFVPRVFLLGSGDPYYVIWSTAFPALVWVAAFALLALESDRFDHFSTEALPGLSLVLNCGLIALLISDLANFSLLVPTAATTFFALLGVAIAVRSTPQVQPRPVSRVGRWLPVAVTAGVLVAIGVGVVLPVAGARRHLMAARGEPDAVPALPLEAQPAYHHYLRAAAADPLDPTPLVECSRWITGYAELAGGVRDAITRAIEQMDRAIERDPRSVTLRRHHRMLWHLLGDVTGEPGAYQRAADAARRATELYPESPDDWAALGECLLRAGETGDDGAVLNGAIRAFAEALRLDAARPDWEKIRRFSDAKRDEIRQKLASAQRLLETRPQ